MRNINFIRPIPEQRRKEFARWALGSAIVLSSSILAIGGLSIMQWRIYRTILEEKKDLAQQLVSYDLIMNQQRIKTQEETTLLQKLSKIEEYTHRPKNPIDIITTVQKTLGSAPLQSLSINTEHFELKGNCANATYATQLVRKLNTLPLCKQASLCSINTGNNNLHFVIKGSLA